MKWLLVAALTASVLPFLKLSNYPPEERYKQWYLPVVLFIEALVMLFLYNRYMLRIHDFFLSFEMTSIIYYIEFAFVIAGMVIMLCTKKILKSIKLYDLIGKLIPNTLTNNSKYNDTFFYFPYVQKPMGVRPGVGYLSLFYLVCGIVCLLFILLSILIGMNYDIYIRSGLFAFTLPVFVEMYNFYHTSLTTNEPAEETEEDVTDDEDTISLNRLWDEYTVTFRGSFDVAFGTGHIRDLADVEVQNENSFNTIINEFRNGRDIIIEDLDIPTSFHKLSDLFFSSLTKGGNILILADIPGRHNTRQNGKDISMMELLTQHLSEYLQKNVPASNEVLKITYLSNKAGEKQFKSRIIMASVSTILESNILSIQWFSDLDLLLVINLDDKGRVNFFENQKFNLLIDQKNNTFQTVILSPFRQGLQASMKRVWKLNKTTEKKMAFKSKAKNHYCLLSNFEKWHENWLNIATPLGTNLYSGTELAIPAIAAGIPTITYLEVHNAEIQEGKENLSLSRNHIIKYGLAQNDIDNIIQINILPFYMFKPGKQQFNIVYDVENNLAAMYRKWLHLGEENNFSIIISKPYLFKSYFADNIHLFKRTPMLSVEPVPSLSKVNLAILLYNILMEDKITESQIKKILNDYDISLSDQTTAGFLKELFVRYFNFDIEENSRLQVEETVVFTKEGYHKTYLYSLAPFKISHFPMFAPLRTIKILDNRGVQLFTILKDMLFQNYLPGQKHVFDGRTFEIASYDDMEGTLIIRNLPQFNNHLFYAPCFNITHNDKALHGTTEDKISLQSLDSKFSLMQFETFLQVETHSYYEFRKVYQAITHNNLQEVLRINLSDAEQKMVKRSYKNCRVMKLEWELKNTQNLDIPQIQAGIHLLLFEAFRSFFPYNYQYIVVCSDTSALTEQQKEETEQLSWIFPEFQSEAKPGCIEIFIFEDTMSDMGILNAIRGNYVYIFKYIYDYLCWLEEPKNQRVKALFTRYENNIDDKTEFLKYGFDSLPAFLDIAALKAFADVEFPLDRVTRMELQNARK